MDLAFEGLGLTAFIAANRLATAPFLFCSPYGVFGLSTYGRLDGSVGAIREVKTSRVAPSASRPIASVMQHSERVGPGAGCSRQARRSHGLTRELSGQFPTLDVGLSVANEGWGLGPVVSFVAVILIIGFAVVAVGWAIGRDV
ncbi:hypothetical protein [Bradyrhizobium monzae]|uniref:hypothetical protein n=1 Tax=Bradyrhizobium sp. Oc8 TaxID=2876780 RepID=UPI001F434837|nr:hypothetical protein [Bradyrhizobium sp. Oc8]